jgi:hypothetical protein
MNESNEGLPIPIPEPTGSVQGYEYYREIPIEPIVEEIITPAEPELTDQTNQPYEPKPVITEY